MAADVPEQEQGDQEESGTWSPAGHRDRGVVTTEACGAFRNAVTENRIEMDFCRYFLTIEACAGIVLSNTPGLVELLRMHNKTFWLGESNVT